MQLTVLLSNTFSYLFVTFIVRYGCYVLVLY